MKYLSFTKEELSELREADPVMDALIEQAGLITEKMDDSLFYSIVHHILGQQISSAVHRRLWERLRMRAGNEITPEKITELGQETLREIGMSYRKAETILSVAEAVKSGELDLESLEKLPDEKVIGELTRFRGIGPWTAEMVLMFGLGRKDVFSFGDIALKRGIMKVYGMESLSKEEFEVLRERFSPNGTLACLYFWMVGEGRI